MSDRTIKAIFATLVALIIYSMVGVGTRVDEIKKEARQAIDARGWKIMRYEGYQWGSWMHHGGKVWYHVADKENPQIQYRVYITKWSGELQFWYGPPEVLNRVDVKL